MERGKFSTPAKKTQKQMNTDIQRTITQADVVAWFASFIPAEHAGKIAVGYDSSYSNKFTASAIPYESGRVKFADSLGEAVAALVAGIKSPVQLAAEKREQAAKLLAEAEALAPAPSAEEDADEENFEREPDYDAPKPLTPLENSLQNDEHAVR